MNEYQLIEYTAHKKITTIHSMHTNLYHVLVDVYKDKINSLFDDVTGQPKGFVSIFVNSKQLFSAHRITLHHRDEIQIVTSVSGG